MPGFTEGPDKIVTTLPLTTDQILGERSVIIILVQRMKSKEKQRPSCHIHVLFAGTGDELTGHNDFPSDSVNAGENGQ